MSPTKNPNKDYPLISLRTHGKTHKDALEELIADAIEAASSESKFDRKPKRNEILSWALEIGLKDIIRRKSG